MTVTCVVVVVVGIHVRCTLDKVSRCAATRYILASPEGCFPVFLVMCISWLVGWLVVFSLIGRVDG